MSRYATDPAMNHSRLAHYTSITSPSYALLMQEKAAREADRQELADLWPDGWLMPTILKRYRSLTEEEKQAKRDKAEAIDAERTLRADIRAKVRVYA